MRNHTLYTENESVLLTAFHQGESWALERVYQLFLPQLCIFTNSLIADTLAAEDIAAECFVTAYRKTDAFASLGRLKNFLFTSARNASLNFIKERERHTAIHAHLGQLTTPFAEDPEKIYLLLEAAQLIYTEINNLPPQCAEVVRRFLVEGKSADEIALELDIAYKTVLNQRTKGLQLLRIALANNIFLSFPVIAVTLSMLPD